MPIQKVAGSELQDVLAKQAGPTPVMFWADWCGFCARFLPAYRARGEGSDKPFLLVDISDEDDPAWDTYRIEVVPTVIVFRDGKPAARVGGVLGEAHLKKVLEEGQVA